MFLDYSCITPVSRLFLYNTCLVICGLCMSVSNYLQPMFAALTGSDCLLPDLPDLPDGNTTLACLANNCTTTGKS